MNKYAVGIELEDIVGKKWGQLEKGLNELLKTSGVNGRLEIKSQAHLANQKPVISFELELRDS